MTQRQTERINRIVGAMRQLLGEKDAESVTMKDVARLSGVAEGTLYNRFSTKDELIVEAIIEFYEKAVASRLDHSQAKSPLERIEGNVATVSKAISRSKSFARSLMGTLFKVENDRTMPDRLNEKVYATWMPMLLELRGAGALCPWVSLPLLCQELCDREFDTVLKWAQQRFADRELRERMMLAVLMSMRATTQGPVYEEIGDALAALSLRLEPSRRK